MNFFNMAALQASGASASRKNRKSNAPRLTQRQQEVAQLLAQGMTNKNIGSMLGISGFTVRDHVSALLKKFSVANRAALARILFGATLPVNERWSTRNAKK